MDKFTKDSIFDAVGTIIASSKNCRQSIRQKGIRQHFICKIYNKDSNMVAEYTTTQKGVFKAITRDMHKIGEGFVEGICHLHPRF
jgi:hypothetical protein